MLRNSPNSTRPKSSSSLQHLEYFEGLLFAANRDVVLDLFEQATCLSCRGTNLRCCAQRQEEIPAATTATEVRQGWDFCSRVWMVPVNLRLGKCEEAEAGKVCVFSDDSLLDSLVLGL